MVKIDTESTEPAVLRGMAGTIARWRPVITVEVLRGRTEEPLEQFVRDSDYRAIWLRKSGSVLIDRLAGDDAHSDLNFLFVPAEKLSSVLATLSAAGIAVSAPAEGPTGAR